MERNIKKRVTTRIKNNITATLLFLLLLAGTSCERTLDVTLPASSILKSQVFGDDLGAEAAVRGIYVRMVSNAYNGYAIAWPTGLSADELNYLGTDVDHAQFLQNTLLADNGSVISLWTDAYNAIYQANNVIEGVGASTGMSAEAKNQFRGEALFLRAFYHFYLVNFFGDVPLVTTTDYRVNAKITRAPVERVYNQIEADLKEAVELLTTAYPTTGRVRANKAVATALLARTYLYEGKWADAETTATSLLSNTTDYGLVALSDITLANNKEAIWQMHPSSSTNPIYTNEGSSFDYGGVYHIVLRDDFVGTGTLPGAFESGDARKTTWISPAAAYPSYNVPHKYQVNQSGGGAGRNEYSTIFRLAEQYLIRAEARAQQNKLSLAIADLDAIRGRAGLPLVSMTNPNISKTGLLDAIMQERRVELFTEWGHRWFDLKRIGRVLTVLGAIKTGFTANDELYPIPADELNKNLNLEQNPGY